MPTTTIELFERADRARNPEVGFKLANNTTVRRLAGAPGRAEGVVAVRLHKTDILTVYALEGNPYQVTLSTGGWDSLTTRDRMARFLPYGVSLRVRAEHGLTVYTVGSTDYVVTYGHTFTANRSDDLCTWTAGPDAAPLADPRVQAALRLLTRAEKLYGDAWARAWGPEFNMDTGGDCWGCLFRPADGAVRAPAAGEPMGVGHLLEHIGLGEEAEHYLVPSLLLTAAREGGANVPYLRLHTGASIARLVRGYLRRRRAALLAELLGHGLDDLKRLGARLRELPR